MKPNEIVGPMKIEDEVIETIEDDIELLPSESGMLPTGSVKNIDDIFWLAENADRLNEAYNKISAMILNIAKPGDWITFSSDSDPVGTAEIGFAGTFRIAARMGVSYVDRKCVQLKGRDKIGEWVRFEVEVTCIFRGTQVRTWGRASSRDPFFGIKDGKYKDLSDVNIGNLKMAAIRAAMKEGVKVLLGLHHFPVKDLKDAGITIRSTKGHFFSSKGGDNGGKISEAQQGRLFKLCKIGGKTPEELKKYLKANYNIEASAEIGWKDYSVICNWAEGKAAGTKEPIEF